MEEAAVHAPQDPISGDLLRGVMGGNMNWPDSEPTGARILSEDRFDRTNAAQILELERQLAVR
jgi:hypothetical protein